MEYDIEQYFYLKSIEYYPIDKKKGIKSDKACRRRLGVIAMGVRYGKNALFITFAGSACSKLDNFNVKAGRNMALGRLRSDNAKTRKCTVASQSIGDVKLWGVINELHLDFALDAQYVDMKFCEKRFGNVIEFIEKKVKEIQEKK